MTLQEMLVDYQVKYSRMTGKVHLGLTDEEMVWMLNDAMYDYIIENLNRKKNPGGEDVNDTKESTLILESLITSKQLDLFKVNNDVYGIFPPDLLHLDRIVVDVDDTCSATTIATTSKSIKRFVVPMPTVTLTNSWSVSAVIAGTPTTLFDGANIGAINLPVEINYDLVYRIQNLSNLKGKFEVYWESYKDVYEKNSLIFVYIGTSNLGTVTQVLEGNSSTLTVTTETLSRVNYSGTTKEVEAKIMPFEHLGISEQNPFAKSKRTFPSAYIKSGTIFIKVKDFIPKLATIWYYKQPKRLDILLKQGVEIGSTLALRYKACAAIVDIAVEKTKFISNNNS